MNEQLQNTVNTVLQKAIEGATQGAEFLKDQIPDVIQQLLVWKLVENCLYAGVFASFICFCVGAANTILCFLHHVHRLAVAGLSPLQLEHSHPDSIAPTPD